VSSRASPGFPPRRILVAIDASPPSLAALRAAVELAARLHAELEGLFVEDIDLLRLARLEVASHVSLLSGSRERLDLESLEAQLRGLAEQARRALSEATLRSRVSGRFRVARGPVVREVVSASDEADLLVIGWASRPLWPRHRLGRTAQAAAERTHRSALVLPEGARLDGPVAVVADDAAGVDTALAIAAGLAEATRSQLRVLVPSRSPEESRVRIEQLRRRLEERRVAWEPIPLADSTPVRLRHALRQHDSAIVVIAADSPLLRDEGVRQLIEELGCALLLAR
jgi:nucleotide-binding universal stress UspA family protein